MSERMLERADELNNMLLDKKLMEIRNKVPVGIGPCECDCGNSIPEPRRQGGYKNCIECQRVVEVEGSRVIH